MTCMSAPVTMIGHLPANGYSTDMSQSNPNANSEDSSLPSGKIGFAVMTFITGFVAAWMFIAGDRSAESGRSEFTAETTSGFNANAWQLPDEDLLGFVEIEAGEFTMGSNPGLDPMAYENERWSSFQRQGSLTLNTYYIARFETTIAQFRHFVADAGISVNSAALEGPPNAPVSNITWAEAVAFTHWLDAEMRQSDQTPDTLKQFLDSGAEVRLPSEAEWEKAARSVDGRIFPWGSQPTSQFANFQGSGKLPVGNAECDACAYGLSDMAGNVWEITRSPFQDYPYDPEDDAADLSQDALWTMRGGSYADAINNVRAAVRGGVDPGVRTDTIGFRVVISSH